LSPPVAAPPALSNRTPQRCAPPVEQRRGACHKMNNSKGAKALMAELFALI